MVGTRELRERIRPFVERAAAFSGWGFGAIAPKPLGPEPPWSYADRASALLRISASFLDLGTGGGEVLEGLCRGFRGRGVASEPWRVNDPIAAKRLSPLGIGVVQAHSLALPFRDGAFELVLSRHEELDPAEVARVLSPNGTALTQQVGANDWRELRAFLPRMQDFGDLFQGYRDGFRAAGLRIVRARAHDTTVAYRGLGEVVFMLCVSPWTIPAFDPLGGDLRALGDLEAALSRPDGIPLTESRFLIEAAKGA